MSELTEFLRARLDEDELKARAGFSHLERWVHVSPAGIPNGLSCTAVLREVEAKRRIMELHRPVQMRSTGSGEGIVTDCQICDRFPAQYPCGTLRLLALPYDDHSDYREEWRP